MAECGGCKGTGNCTKCNGKGGSPGLLGKSICSKCGGSGNCTVCKGSGKKS